MTTTTIRKSYRSPFEESTLQSLVRWVREREELPSTVSLVFVDRDEIARWNREHRGDEGPTDVLSYVFDDEGEVLVCPAYVDSVVAEQPRTRRELYWDVILHGLLHVAGYDHEIDDGEHLSRQDQLLSDWLRRRNDGEGDLKS